MPVVRGRKKLAAAIGCSPVTLSRFNKKIPLPVEREEITDMHTCKYYDVEKCRKVMKDNFRASVMPHYLQD